MTEVSTIGQAEVAIRVKRNLVRPPWMRTSPCALCAGGLNESAWEAIITVSDGDVPVRVKVAVCEPCWHAYDDPPMGERITRAIEARRDDEPTGTARWLSLHAAAKFMAAFDWSKPGVENVTVLPYDADTIEIAGRWKGGA